MTTTAASEARFVAWLAEHGGIIHKIVRAYAARAGEEALVGAVGGCIFQSCKSA